jgi:carboxymethylenebutenolidase
MAERCAALGHIAFVPDLLRGQLPKTLDEGLATMAALDFADAVDQDLRGAAALLARDGLRVALLGFCMGGALAIAGALRVPDLAAAVCFYGVPSAEAGDPAEIRIPLQCHFADRDDWCTPEKVEALERRLIAGHVPYELHRYDADHAFMNPTGRGYSETMSARAWQRTVEFIERRIAPGASSAE